MKNSLQWGRGALSEGPVPPEPVGFVRRRRETMMPDNVAHAAMVALAAVIEEPFCLLGHDELKQAVHAFSMLSRVMSGEGAAHRSDYAFVDGAAVSGADHSYVIKRPVTSDAS